MGNDHRADDHEPGEGQEQGHGVRPKAAGGHLQGTVVPQPTAKIASMDQAAQVERLPTMRLTSSGGTTAHIWSL